MNGERFTLDTNILIYSIDPRAGSKQAVARQVVGLAAQADCWLTLQAVSEFYAACIRKGLLVADDAAAQASDWLDLFPCLPASATAVRIALATAAAKRASYWDALLLAAAAEGGCRAVLTEDMSSGTMIAGLRVVNPFEDGKLGAAAMRILSPPRSSPEG